MALLLKSRSRLQLQAASVNGWEISVMAKRFSRRLALLLFMMAIIFFSSVTVAAQGLYQAGSTGVDVSWPPANCKAAEPSDTAFGIVGVTGGLDFKPNNCLLTEASWFTSRSLYMNTGYPGAALAAEHANGPHQCEPQDNRCVAFDYGYNAAEYALLYAASQNVHSTAWWLDVETENSWSTNAQENRAALNGMIAAIHRTVFFPTIGIYSTPKQWKQIMGNWQNNLPNWVGTGSSERSDALAACQGSDFTGGGTQLTQYILKLDHDYVCP